MRRPSRRAWALAVAIGITLGMMAGTTPAWAFWAQAWFVLEVTPTGGYVPECASHQVWYNNGGNTVVDQQDARYSWGGHCNNPRPRPALWIGVQPKAFRNGALCAVGALKVSNTNDTGIGSNVTCGLGAVTMGESYAWYWINNAYVENELFCGP